MQPFWSNDLIASKNLVYIYKVIFHQLFKSIFIDELFRIVHENDS